MTNFTNTDSRIIFRLKKSKLKINASLSAICSKLDLLPTKVLSRFEAKSKEVPVAQEKFFLSLTKQSSAQDGFDLVLLPNPDSTHLRNLRKQHIREKTSESNIKKEIHEYASSTMFKSYTTSIESRFNELMGHYNSFK